MLSSDSPDSDGNNNDDDKNGAKDNNCYSDGDGANISDGGDDSIGARGGSVEWMRFLNPSALLEKLGAMAKAKASLSKKSRKT